MTDLSRLPPFDLLRHVLAHAPTCYRARVILIDAHPGACEEMSKGKGELVRKDWNFDFSEIHQKRFRYPTEDLFIV